MIEKLKTNCQKAWSLIKLTSIEFNNDNVTKLSASLSYSTIFSLPPLLIIIISVCGIFFGPQAVRGEIFGQIHKLVGTNAALQIQEAIKNIHLSHHNTFAAVVGVIILLVGASSVFAEIQGSINYIWGIEAKPKRGFAKFIKNRLMSFSMIGTVGFLFMVGLIINSAMDLLDTRLTDVFPQITIRLFYFFNTLILFVIITLLFVTIFKTLPDGKVSMKDAFIGASFTAVLFMIGKFAIGAYLGSSTVASVYGAAGSVIIILVWVYYSAIILYFGAEFTKVYADVHGEKIIPNEYSIYIKKNETVEPTVTVEA